MKVKSEIEVTQSCPTLSDPMECSPPVSSTHGVFQAGVLEWGAIAFFEDAVDEGVPNLAWKTSRGCMPFDLVIWHIIKVSKEWSYLF